MSYGGDTCYPCLTVSTQAPTQMVSGPAPTERLAASAAWWAAFWAQSYISTPPQQAAPRVGVFSCTGAPSQTVLLAPNGSLTLPGGLCFGVSASNQIVAVPCPSTTQGSWSLIPCTTPGCNSQGDYYVALDGAGEVGGLPQVVFDLPGASCPWLDTYPAVSPQGQYKNEIFFFNATDSTLRTRCLTCLDMCVTVVAEPSSDSISAQYARTRFIQAVQVN